MTPSDAKLGTRVKALRDFSGVPQGTEGVIDQDCGCGVMVAWDLPGRPLPPGYAVFDGQLTVSTRILRDGFNKANEFWYIETVSIPTERPGPN